MNKYAIKIIILAALSALFAVIAALVFTGAFGGFEAAVYNQIAKLISPPMTSFMKVITYAGSFWFLCGLCVLLVILPQTRKKFGYPVAAAAILSALLNLILKNIFRRARPFDTLLLVSESGFSFPSGHSQSCAAVFIALALF